MMNGRNIQPGKKPEAHEPSRKAQTRSVQSKTTVMQGLPVNEQLMLHMAWDQVYAGPFFQNKFHFAGTQSRNPDIASPPRSQDPLTRQRISLSGIHIHQFPDQAGIRQESHGMHVLPVLMPSPSYSSVYHQDAKQREPVSHAQRDEFIGLRLHSIPSFPAHYTIAAVVKV